MDRQAHDSMFAWDQDYPAKGVLRVAFSGPCGVGSAGNRDGLRMRQIILEAVAASMPDSLILDFCALRYQFGDWIPGTAIEAMRQLGIGKVCVVATGESAISLRSLWYFAKLDHVIPLFETLNDAMEVLSMRGQNQVEESTD